MSKYVLIFFSILCFFIVHASKTSKQSDILPNKICLEEHRLLYKVKRKLQKKKKISSKRNLATSIIYSECTDTTKYTIDETTKKITRVDNNKFDDEYYVMLNSPILFEPSPPTSQIQVKYDLKINNLGDGLIFFGACRTVLDTSTKNCKGSDSVFFSGIAPIYFGDNCFHIDAFNDSSYKVSVRSCLATSTIQNFTFNVVITYTPTSTSGTLQSLKVEITFDNQKWYNTEDYQDLTDPLSDKKSLSVVGKILPCIWMYQQGTEVQLFNYTP